MRAVVFKGVDRLAVEDVREPAIEDPGDAVVRIAAAGICGSDLHFLHGKAPLSPGDTIGHEGAGVIEEVGPQVRRFRPGDRVVIAFDIVCGDCWYCRRGQTALCEDFQMLGGGAFGGNLVGAQAEKVRVPSADVNLLSIPEGMEDERALFVGDILTTGYYGTAIAGIGPEDTVAVVGAGPVGFFCVQAAHLQGARRVLALDRLEDRLALAEKVGAIPINVDETNPQMAVSELTDGRGADVVIEAVGHPSAYETAFDVVRGGGTISVVGVFVSEQVQVPLGVYWARALRVLFAGICPIHAWWERAMEAVRAGAIDPLPIISHVLSLEEAVRGYELFDSRRATKVVLKP
ncbi:MAG TPA: alcohol dehydrogenase catalytic domain-containing protein [Actinomycetota bacterium]|nr:alcohol dehydrogenase catalytic domain-containing protein [Actinomycetota bacterium]